MKLLVVGSMALDTIETPFGKEENILGGSASYFSLAASMFTDVGIVAVVGKDFPESHLDLFRSKNIELEGVTREEGETFKWEGKYGYDLGDPDTLGTYLNVFENFNPVIPENYSNVDYVFLANIDPELQLSVLKQVKNPKLVACDTMNFWIDNKPQELKEVLKHVDILLINDSETRALAVEPRITTAARAVLDMGPKILIVKRGETGAGDTFAGGFMGYIAGNDITTDPAGFKTAVVNGSVIASFTVENFSVRRLSNLTKEEISTRFAEFLKLSKVD
jgi:sugar/nucleoside kinase (ribokinase family)